MKWPGMLSILSLAVLALLAIAALPTGLAASPAVSITRFANLPSRLAYVDDSPVVFYHDSVKGEVWRSEDEGKSWKTVDGPPKGSAYLLVEHPYDHRMVSIRRVCAERGHCAHTSRAGLHPFQRKEALAVDGSWQDVALL